MSDESVVAIPGLTRLDWIAVQVLAALISRGDTLGSYDGVASEAYKLARAMEKAKERVAEEDSKAVEEWKASPEGRAARERSERASRGASEGPW